MKEAIEAGDTFDRAELRQRCAECRHYKADKIMLLCTHIQRGNLLNINKDRPTRGSVVEKRYGKAVLALRKEGKSLRDISSMLDIAVNSVQKILKANPEVDAEQISL
jgi:hypothetical protein